MENQVRKTKVLLLFLFLAAILVMYSCKREDAAVALLSEAETQAIDGFDKDYFGKYNKEFIQDTDDNNFPDPENVQPLDFHTWAWQKYLYLTQYKRPDGSTATRPYFLEDTVAYQITDHGDIIKRMNAPLILELFHQAGSAQPVLATNPDFGDGISYTVYYSIHMNDIMFNQMRQNVIKKVNEIDKSKFPQDLSDPTEEFMNSSLEL